MVRSRPDLHPAPTARQVLIGCALAILGFAGFIFATHWVQGRTTSFGQALLWAAPVCLLWALAVPLVARLDRMADGFGRGRALAIHLVGAVGVSLVMAVARLALGWAWAPNEIGGAALMQSGVRFFGLGLLVYAALVGLIHALRPVPPPPQSDPTAPAEPSFPDALSAGLPEAPDSVTVVVRGRSIAVPWRAVGWIEAAGNYATLHTGGKTHLIRQTLQQLEDTLDPARFVRIHRSTLVNLDHLDPQAPVTDTVCLRTGETLRVSRTGRARLVARTRVP